MFRFRFMVILLFAMIVLTRHLGRTSCPTTDSGNASGRAFWAIAHLDGRR